MRPNAKRNKRVIENSKLVGREEEAQWKEEECTPARGRGPTEGG